MPTSSLKRWLLVDYAGYPFAPNSLMPDNGLANLAGALVAGGSQVKVLDYCTVSTLRELTSPELSARLLNAWKAMHQPLRGWPGNAQRMVLLLRLQRCERARQRLHERATDRISRDLVEKIRRDRIEAVGFKLWNGDGLEGSAQIARAIRRHCPDTRIFAGGPQVDFFLELILHQYPYFDALVYGEGEETIRRLAETGGDSRSFETIPNLLYPEDGAVRTTPERMIGTLDDLPLPLYDPAVYPAMAGDEKIKVIVVDESRGCANQCAFCVHPMKSHRTVRTKSIERLIREIEVLIASGYRTFRFAGSCTPYPLLNRFAAEIVRSKARVSYASFAHFRDSENADFPLLNRSGCLALFFGIESGSQRVLDLMNKGIRADGMEATIRRVKEAGIFTVGSLIFPAPGETAATEEETIGLLQVARPDSVMLQAPIVGPRTGWFQTPERYGLDIPSKTRYLHAALHWKAKLLLPPAFWTSLPVRVDGQRYRRVLQRATRFALRMRSCGLAMNITDETALMAMKAGMVPEAFKEEASMSCFTGDAARLQDLVARVNAGIG